MKKLRILYIIYTLDAGGIESLAVNLLRNIDRDKFNVDFLVIKDPAKVQFYDNEVLKLGGKIIPVGNCNANKIKKYITCKRDMWNVIKNGRYDVVHIHSGHIHTLPEIIFAKVCGVKNIIVHSHNGELTTSAKFHKSRCAMQSIYRRLVPVLADNLLTCSDLAAEWSFSKRSIKNGNVIQINNGIDTVRFMYNEEKRKVFRNTLGLKNEFLIGHIGRFNVQKNHEFLLNIFAEVKKIKSDAKFLLCGKGELENKMRRLAEDLNIADDVIFYGVTNEIPEVLSAIDVFVFPSLFEGLPVVGVEVQAAGVPIVASDTITKEVAVTPCWHWMSLNDNPSAWAEKIIEITEMSERVDTHEMITAAGFDIKDTVKKIEAIYEN